VFQLVAQFRTSIRQGVVDGNRRLLALYEKYYASGFNECQKNH